MVAGRSAVGDAWFFPHIEDRNDNPVIHVSSGSQNVLNIIYHKRDTISGISSRKYNSVLSVILIDLIIP